MHPFSSEGRPSAKNSGFDKTKIYLIYQRFMKYL